MASPAPLLLNATADCTAPAVKPSAVPVKPVPAPLNCPLVLMSPDVVNVAPVNAVPALPMAAALTVALVMVVIVALVPVKLVPALPVLR